MTYNMNIAITGATGLVGKKLVEDLSKQHKVHVISRQRGNGHIYWNPAKGVLDRDALEGMDVIIHLAGANIADNRWTSSYKKTIYKSRVDTTRFLVDSINHLNRKPKLFISASAVGFYGNNRMTDHTDENSIKGIGFLPDVCEAWEEQSKVLVEEHIRVVHLRFGVVLAREGGALAKMLPVFKFCMGGMLGTGKQPMSWISIHEIPSIIDFIIKEPSIFGPVNAVAPQSVSNKEFSQTLCDVLHRPLFLPVPAAVIMLLLGEMGKELLLEGVNVFPNVLVRHGYHFQYPHLRGALEKILK